MRIAIVNDLPLVVALLKRALSHKPEYELAWIAGDGAEAIERCAQDKPDLILMDLVMPKLGGVEATRRIMAKSPCAILVVTVSVELNAAGVFEAMGAGALDAVDTPTLVPGEEWSGFQNLLNKIETIRKLIGESAPKLPPLPARFEQPTRPTRESLIVIGASAGGPNALARVLGSLPAGFPSAILVVQHVDAQFAPKLAQWLDGQTQLSVRPAQAGDRPTPGEVLVAGTNDHLVLVNPTTLAYVPEPLDLAYRPSVDVLFQSVLRHWRGKTIAVLLTGMGCDGATGLKALRAAGVHTIAQDRASCAVYGMPKAAVELDAAVEILPLEKIGPRLCGEFRPCSQPHS